MHSEVEYEYEDEDNELMSQDDELNNEDHDIIPEEVRSEKLKYFTVLDQEDIRRLQEDVTTEVSTILSISKHDASILLRNSKWSVSKATEDWFTDEDRVRTKVGLMEVRLVEFPEKKNVSCGICFDSYGPDEISNVACGHPFCKSCWLQYIKTSIVDGPGCLMLRCPIPSCGAAVGQDMVNLLVSDEDRLKYDQYLRRSYVESQKRTKWCPAPGCDCAIDFDMGVIEGFDVTCKCTNSFCWKCSEEAHRPAECDIVKQWTIKNSAESENTNWILANTKPCPNCHRAIEKNQGCSHMHCSQCKTHFCWLCLNLLSEHNRADYKCNAWDMEKQQGVFSENEKRRVMAQQSLAKYTHFYERWATNHSSRQIAINDLQMMKDVSIHKLVDRYATKDETQLQFIIDAWLQIIECRRALKWTYAYGYYLPDHENIKRGYFVFVQGEAENALERLHQCSEKELQEFLKEEEVPPASEFNDFRRKLTGLTVVTRNYFEKLVNALENGLPDVKTSTVGSSSNDTNSIIYGQGSIGKGEKRKRLEKPWS